MKKGYIEQLPTPPNEWLYKDKSEDLSQRLWSKKVFYREGSPKWDEATQEEYDKWQEEYNPPMSEEQENQQEYEQESI